MTKYSMVSIAPKSFTNDCESPTNDCESFTNDYELAAISAFMGVLALFPFFYFILHYLRGMSNVFFYILDLTGGG